MKADVGRVALLALLLATGHCQAKDAERAADRAKATATSEADASSDVVDAELAFRLKRPGPGWKMLHREDAAGLVGGAVAAAISPHDVVGSVHVVAASGPLPRHVESMVARMPLDERKLTLGATEDGDDTRSQLFDVDGRTAGAPIHFTGKAVARGKLVYEIVAWSPPAEGTSESGADVKAFLKSFALTDGAVEPKLLPGAARTPTATVGADFAWRGGRYRDYRLALTLEPDEGWAVQTGAAARAIHPRARVYLHDAERGLHAMLTADAAEGDAKANHARLVAQARVAVAMEPGESRKGKLGEADALVSEGRATVGGDATRYRITSSLHDERVIALWTWGAPDAMTAATERLDALAAAVDLEVALPAVEATTATYRDHRMGYTLTTPSGWTRQELTPERLAGSGSLLRWDNDGQWIAVLAAALPGVEARHPWMVSFLEQLLRDELSAVTLATATRGEGELGGEAATHVAWHAPLQEVDALLVHRGGVVYAVITVDHGPQARDLVRRAFAFLP